MDGKFNIHLHCCGNSIYFIYGEHRPNAGSDNHRRIPAGFDVSRTTVTSSTRGLSMKAMEAGGIDSVETPYIWAEYPVLFHFL